MQKNRNDRFKPNMLHEYIINIKEPKVRSKRQEILLLDLSNETIYCIEFTNLFGGVLSNMWDLGSHQD